MFIDTFATAGLPVDLDDSNLMDDFTAGSVCGQTMSAGTHGWFFDLAAGRGEQAVTASSIFGGLVFFSTNRPVPPTAAACSTNLGEARGYAVNILNASGAADTLSLCGGGRSAIFAGGGLPPSPVTGTVPVGPNAVPVTVMIGGVNRGGGVSTPIGAQRVSPTITQRRSRAYWYVDVDK
jgi:type IV pilus assembly protein PilY1